jgi:hypothetical protein
MGEGFTPPENATPLRQEVSARASYAYARGRMFGLASWLTNTQAGRLIDSER